MLVADNLFHMICRRLARSAAECECAASPRCVIWIADTTTTTTTYVCTVKLSLWGKWRKSIDRMPIGFVCPSKDEISNKPVVQRNINVYYVLQIKGNNQGHHGTNKATAPNNTQVWIFTFLQCKSASQKRLVLNKHHNKISSAPRHQCKSQSKITAAWKLKLSTNRTKMSNMHVL